MEEISSQKKMEIVSLCLFGIIDSDESRKHFPTAEYDVHVMSWIPVRSG